MNGIAELNQKEVMVVSGGGTTELMARGAVALATAFLFEHRFLKLYAKIAATSASGDGCSCVNIFNSEIGTFIAGATLAVYGAYEFAGDVGAAIRGWMQNK